MEPKISQNKQLHTSKYTCIFPLAKTEVDTYALQTDIPL